MKIAPSAGMTILILSVAGIQRACTAASRPAAATRMATRALNEICKWHNPINARAISKNQMPLVAPKMYRANPTVVITKNGNRNASGAAIRENDDTAGVCSLCSLNGPSSQVHGSRNRRTCGRPPVAFRFLMRRQQPRRQPRPSQRRGRGEFRRRRGGIGGERRSRGGRER